MTTGYPPDVMMTLKDIVELCMSPSHTDESIDFLDSLIADHRHSVFHKFFHRRS